MTGTLGHASAEPLLHDPTLVTALLAAPSSAPLQCSTLCLPLGTDSGRRAPISGSTPDVPSGTSRRESMRLLACLCVASDQASHRYTLYRSARQHAQHNKHHH